MPDASLTEIRALCRKAARGAGYGWGMAEEAGRFAWTLSRRGLDGPGAVLLLAELVEGGDPARHAPDPGQPGWASTTSLCPIATGLALLDRARLVSAWLPLQLQDVLSPVLLVAAVERLRAGGGPTVEMAWAGRHWPPRGGARVGGAGVDAPVANVRWTRGSEAGPPPAAVRQAVDPAVWAALERLALRTCAPATPESRRLGAGDGGPASPPA